GERGRCVGVATTEGRYSRPVVVLATGPWAALLARQAGVKLPVQSCRTQVALFRKPPSFGRRCAIYGDFVHGIYFKPTHGDIVHAGGLLGEEINEPADPEPDNE